MYHANMVHNVVAGIKESLQQEQVKTETMTVVQGPLYHVTNTVQNAQKNLATQLQQMKAMMQAMQMQYAAAVWPNFSGRFAPC